MQHPEYLYHYTTLDFVPKILEDGFLMLTSSNLVKPKRYWKERREDGNYDIVSDTDDVIRPSGKSKKLALKYPKIDEQNPRMETTFYKIFDVM